MARTKTPVPTPFPFLTVEELRGLVATFADRAVVSVNIERDGVNHIVALRDLHFIHSLDASRFGPTSAACPLCQEEVGEL